MVNSSDRSFQSCFGIEDQRENTTPITTPNLSQVSTADSLDKGPYVARKSTAGILKRQSSNTSVLNTSDTSGISEGNLSPVPDAIKKPIQTKKRRSTQSTAAATKQSIDWLQSTMEQLKTKSDESVNRSGHSFGVGLGRGKGAAVRARSPSRRPRYMSAREMMLRDYRRVNQSERREHESHARSGRTGFRPGSLRFAEACNAKKLEIPRTVFMRIVKEIMRTMGKGGVKVQTKALEAMQEAMEDYLIRFMENANDATLHARRVTLMTRDIALISKFERTLV